MSSNPVGRPRKADGPRVPYEELDRILVFGEVVPCEDGAGTMVAYPSYRELAERYGVSHSVIAEYAKTRNVRNRRKEAQARIQAKAEHKLVELRSDAIAYSKDDSLRIIDTYLAGFENALAEKRVRFDNPADFNTMVRLKEFVMGNADSRSEVHASLSLESLQARHRQVIRVTEASPEERGEVEKRPALAEPGRELADSPPPRPTENAVGEPSGGFPGRFGSEAVGSNQVAAVSLPDVAARAATDDAKGLAFKGPATTARVGRVAGVREEANGSGSSRSSSQASSTTSDTICRRSGGTCGSFHQVPSAGEHHDDGTTRREDDGEEHAPQQAHDAYDDEG